ncbi:MAG: ATP-binding cassette domain-containing protein, partial [Acidimicrobiales bacterium]
MSDPLLTIENLTVQFGGVRACDSIDTVVERGELFALIGPNGAGKTTLVNAVTGIYVPLEGAKVELRRRDKGPEDLLSYRPYQIARRGVARTFQNLGLFRSETVLTNLMLGRYIHQKTGVVSGGLFTRRAVNQELETRAAIEQVVDLLDLGAFRRDQVGGLPYG